MAAAIGAGLPVSEPSGSLIVDIGGGTTEVAVISLGGIVEPEHPDRRRRDGPGHRHVRPPRVQPVPGRAHGRGHQDRDRLGLSGRVGRPAGHTARPRPAHRPAAQRRSGRRPDPRSIEPSVQQIVDTIKDTIEETPPELVADIMDQGIVLAGGGALLAGLDRRIAEATQMPVHVADDPLTCVARAPAWSSRSSTIRRCSAYWSPTPTPGPPR